MVLRQMSMATHLLNSRCTMVLTHMSVKDILATCNRYIDNCRIACIINWLHLQDDLSLEKELFTIKSLVTSGLSVLTEDTKKMKSDLSKLKNRQKVC